MVYIAFAAFVFYETLKNVRSVGGFDKGLDYVVAAITTFIFTTVFSAFFFNPSTLLFILSTILLILSIFFLFLENCI